MNRQEAARLLEMRQLLWPNTQPPADAMAEVDLWATLLAAYPLEQLAQAMDRGAAAEFAPTLGQLREAINPTPTYADVLAEFRMMLGLGYSPTYVPPDQIPWSHPLIAAAAGMGLWMEWGQSPDATSDPSMVQAEAAFRAHFRESFKGVHARWVAGGIALASGSPVAEIEQGQRVIEASNEQ